MQLGAATIGTTLAGCGGGIAIGTGPIKGLDGSTLSAPEPTTAPNRVRTTGVLANIALSGPSSLGFLSNEFVGLSYEKSMLSTGFFSATNSSLIGCFKGLGTSVLRIGGNSVDQIQWSTMAEGPVSGQVSPTQVNSLAAFLQATGWKCIYGLNFGTGNPAMAAREAAYVTKVLGSSLYGLEIGNEPDLYASNGERSSSYDLGDFLTEWRGFARAIEAAVPGVSLTGPATADNTGGWTVPFASDVGTEINLLTQHYFRGNGEDPASTIDLLLAGDPNLPNGLQKLDAAAKSNQISGGYRIAECNSYYNGGAPNISDSFGSALWALDFIMTCALYGSSGVNFHSGGDAPGYTPIADNSETVVEVRPEYYAMKLASLIAPGSLYSTTVTCSALMSAYAISGNDGATYILLINKEPTSSILASVVLPTTPSHFTTMALSGPSLSAISGITLGGNPIQSDGSWNVPRPDTQLAVGSTIVADIAPACAVLLRAF